MDQDKTKILIVGAGPTTKDAVKQYLMNYGYSAEEIEEKIDFNAIVDQSLPRLEQIPIPTLTKAELKKPKAWYDEMYYGYNPYRKGPMRFGGKKKGR